MPYHETRPNPMHSPRFWALIYAGLIGLLAVIVGAHDWVPRTLVFVFTIPPLIWYGVTFSGVYVTILFAHVYIGDRWHIIEDYILDWVADADPTNAENEYTRYKN